MWGKIEIENLEKSLVREKVKTRRVTTVNRGRTMSLFFCCLGQFRLFTKAFQLPDTQSFISTENFTTIYFSQIAPFAVSKRRHRKGSGKKKSWNLFLNMTKIHFSSQFYNRWDLCDSRNAQCLLVIICCPTRVEFVFCFCGGVDRDHNWNVDSNVPKWIFIDFS